ncbi:MAG: PspC domain-containing protein [Anaerolineae bacterium]|nr:PspC domain-containing protein [Anaerolineae bacterium]
MLRSFTDRVFGGVCGGLATALPIDAWIIRIAFVVLALISLGGFAALYLILWWITPQESPTSGRQRGLGLPLVLILIVLTAALWLVRDQTWLRAPGGESLYLPLILFVVALVFFLRQVRA